MSLFFFSNNFYKNKETFKIFSPLIMEVYRILLMETIIESIIFYYTFSVINTMFVLCTTLLYDSTAATRTLKLPTTLLSICCGIHLISFLVMSSLVWGFFSQTLSFRHPLDNSQAGWDLGNMMARGYWFEAKWVCPMGSYAWGIQVICSRNEVERQSLWKQSTDKRASSEEKSDGFHKKFSIELWTILMFELLLCCHTAAWCMEQT